MVHPYNSLVKLHNFTENPLFDKLFLPDTWRHQASSFIEKGAERNRKRVDSAAGHALKRRTKIKSSWYLALKSELEHLIGVFYFEIIF
jgi:hypothetical protein